MRIVYCTDSVCHAGGIQRITVAKANALADIEGNEVWIVVTDNKRPKPVLPISGKVHLVDLDVNYFEDDWKSRLHVLKGIFVKRREHKRKLQRFLNTISPDIVISTGTSEKNIVPRMKVASNPTFIREIHFTSNYRQLAANGWFEKFSAWAGDIIDYHYYIRKYDKIVVLTNEDKQWHWKNNSKVEVIPNPLTTEHDKCSTLKSKTVITAGRLTAQKNFASLINAWKTVNKHHPDWKLEIWGEGSLRNELQQQIEDLQLRDSACLMGYTDDIISKFADASIFVCTSIFEGLPLVFIEAMSCGIPVVSYACPCGPKDIITEGKDGFLIPVGDERMMAERINKLIEHEDMRLKIGEAAIVKSKHYSTEIVISKWQQLFDDIKAERHENCILY